MTFDSDNANWLQITLVVLALVLLLAGSLVVGGLITQWLLPYTLGVKLGFWKSVLFFILTRG